jgi:hypothetical protein
VKLQERLMEVGVKSELVHADTQNPLHKTGVEFLLSVLKPD